MQRIKKIDSIDKKTVLKDTSESDFSYCLEFYRKIFLSTDPEVLIPLDSNFEKLFSLLKNSLQNSNNQICILYGFPGFGRKSSLDYCLREIRKEKNAEIQWRKIQIDASLHSTETSFIKTFLRQLYQEEFAKFPDSALSFESLYRQFKETKADERIILVIERVEELVSIKKQTVLYGLLEWIRNENNQIFVVFITNNLLFLDLLEKRVKSRLSQTAFYFFSCEFESLFNVIKRRILMYESYPEINNFLIEILQKSPLIDTLHELHGQNKSLAWFMKFFHTLFCCLDLDEDSNENNFIKSLEKKFIAAFYEAANLLNPDFQKIIGSMVNIPQLILLAAIKKFIEINFETTLNFENVMNQIDKFNKQSTAEKSFTKINFSKSVFQQALEELCFIGYLKISGLEYPIDFSKTSWRNNEIILNLPLNELGEFIIKKIKGKELPLYFRNFLDFKLN